MSKGNEILNAPHEDVFFVELCGGGNGGAEGVEKILPQVLLLKKIIQMGVPPQASLKASAAKPDIQ